MSHNAKSHRFHPHRFSALIATVLFVLAAARHPPPARSAAEQDVVRLVVAARTRVGRIRPIWDEVNLWKLYSIFGTQHGDPANWWGAGWLRAHAPWASYVRVVAPLGGNYAPEIARWCDYGLTSPEHPDAHPTDCGRDGKPGAAAMNEPVKLLDGKRTTDYEPFRTAIKRLIDAGGKPHLNITSAPAAFTGGIIDFSHYHWNSAPVRDLDGWRSFVADAFAAVADLDPSNWRVSIINEANCLTLVGDPPQVQHVGYRGTAEQYAHTWVAGVETIRAAVPSIWIHAGNYVTSDTFPGEDNLATYFAALRDEFAASESVSWSDIAAVSVSLYETPDTTLYEFLPVRLARLDRAMRSAGLPAKPVKVDELEIHPILKSRFDASERQPLDTALYAASWHAEALRSFVAAGNVVSVAPWLERLYEIVHWTPYPKLRAYELFGLLTDQLREMDGGANGLHLKRGARNHGLRRLAIKGEQYWPSSAAEPPLPVAASLTAIAARMPHGLRVLVVHHQNKPVADPSSLRDELARRVQIVARELTPGAYTVRHMSIGGPGGAAWDGTTTPALRWQEDGCRLARRGTIKLGARRKMAANTVWLFEATRHRRCPAETPPNPT